MRLPVAAAALLAAALVGGSDAFTAAVPPLFAAVRWNNARPSSRSRSRSSAASAARGMVGGVGQGWENDDFLESLGKGDDAVDEANRKYRARVDLKKAQAERLYGKASDDDEDSALMGGDADVMGGLPERKHAPKEGEDEGQGGRMFQKMMAQAQARKAGVSPSRPLAPEPEAEADLPPPPPPEPEEQVGTALVLHPGWTASIDPNSGQTYYYNQLTGETSWERPGAPPPPPPPPEAGAGGVGSSMAGDAGMPPPPPPPPPPQVGAALMLHPGWTAALDAASGQTYYYNQVTGETTWEKPAAPPPPPPPPQMGGVPPPPPLEGMPQAQETLSPAGAATDPSMSIPTLEEQFRNVKNKRREFDTISNKADVYLAQLKRDSTVRSIARQKGDVDKANAAFGDESIKKLEGWVVKNPHTEEEEKQLWAMVGTSEDEEVRFLDRTPDDGMTDEERESYAGISYREKMAQRRKRAAKEAASGEAAALAPAAAAAPTEEKKEEVVAEEAAAEAVEAATEEEKKEEVAEDAAEVESTPEPEPEPAPIVAAEVDEDEEGADDDVEDGAEGRDAAAAVASASSSASAASASASSSPPPPAIPDPEPLKVRSFASSVPATPEPATADEESARRTLRTVMGLLLKHRGGPGFGGGVLKGPEAERLRGTLAEVTELLRGEAGMGPPAEAPEPEAEEVTEAKKAAPPPPPAAPAAVASSDLPPALAGSFACVEGAISRYRSSSPSERADMLPDLRNAMLGAVNACNRVLAEGGLDENGERATRPEREEFPTAAGEAAATATATATTFGFPSSYAVTQPDEVDEAPAPALKAKAAAPATSMGFPASYAATRPDEAEEKAAEDEKEGPKLEVAPTEEKAAPAAKAAGGDDANTELLRGLMGTIRSCAGEEKFGLKPLTAEEMTKLGDALGDMRGVLMEELDAGIPSAPKAATAAAAASTAVGDGDEDEEGGGATVATAKAEDGGSMYKEKLAKAQAAKAARKQAQKNP